MDSLRSLVTVTLMFIQKAQFDLKAMTSLAACGKVEHSVGPEKPKGFAPVLLSHPQKATDHPQSVHWSLHIKMVSAGQNQHTFSLIGWLCNIHFIKVLLTRSRISTVTSFEGENHVPLNSFGNDRTCDHSWLWELQISCIKMIALRWFHFQTFVSHFVLSSSLWSGPEKVRSCRLKRHDSHCALEQVSRPRLLQGEKLSENLQITCN